MSLRKLYNLLSVLLIMVFSTCRSTQTTTSGALSDTEIIYPVSTLDLPIANFKWYLPETEWAYVEEPPMPNIEITETFCPRDKNHIASTDPKLFANSDTMRIDLSRLQKCNYSFPLPGAKIISPYAGRRKNHSGVDMKTFANDTVRSVFDGIVRMSKNYAAYGNVIVIRHFNGLETVYSHNSKHLVKQGEQVAAGQPIALVGRTGRATTEHLHFETRINGQHFNPVHLFDMDSQSLQNKTLLCIKNNNRIKVSPLDPFLQFYVYNNP